GIWLGLDQQRLSCGVYNSRGDKPGRNGCQRRNIQTVSPILAERECRRSLRLSTHNNSERKSSIPRPLHGRGCDVRIRLRVVEAASWLYPYALKSFGRI